MAMESSRGLGRGLAGILGDTMRSSNAPHANSLLGDRELRRDPAVRRLVTDMAVGAMADLFDTDVVFIVRRDHGSDLPAVACRLPIGWRPDDPMSFEVSGRLWGSLEQPDGLSSDVVDGHHLLVSRQSNGSSALAGAIVRSQPFSDSDQRIISSLVGSVARALDHRSAIPADVGITVKSHDVADGVLAEIELSASVGASHTASSIAPDQISAIAHAAAELCDPPVAVRFVGQTEVEQRTVTLAVVDQSDGGPLFGLAIGGRQALSSAAEAVFSAAAVVDAGPFGADAAAEVTPTARTR